MARRVLLRQMRSCGLSTRPAVLSAALAQQSALDVSSSMGLCGSCRPSSGEIRVQNGFNHGHVSQTSPTLVLLVETSGGSHMQPCVAPAIEPGVGGAYRTRGRVRREAERRVSSLLDLPTDALRLIVSHLPIHAFCQAGATCTHLRDACCDTSRKQTTPTQPVYPTLTPFYQMGVRSPPQRRACKPKP